MKQHLWRMSCVAMWLPLACTSDFDAEYSDPGAVEIVDYNWNETDGRKTSEVLIGSMLSKPWLAAFKNSHGRNPVVIIKSVENRTDEHLDTKTVVEGIRYELINSGSIKFVDGAGRDQILKEVAYQNSGAVSQQTAKKTGKQTGADFMLRGAISSQVHTNKGLKTVTYQTLFQLTDLESSEIIWNEKYDIKKRFKRSGTGW